MTSDQVAIVAIAAAWSAGVGLLGLAVAWLTRRRSLRWQTATVAVTAVAAIAAGIVGTANAMFISDHDLEVVLWVVVVAGVVAIAVSNVIGAVLARWSRSMQSDVRRFGDSGEYVTAGTRGPVELQEISDELAQTAQRLQESRAREARLEESRRELVSWVSHDLRSPLAALRAMTEALEDGLGDPARYHQRMRAEVDRMVRMVDDLFELSRIHAGVLSLNLEPVSLGDVVSEAIAGADPVARAGGVRLGGRVDAALFVTADPGELSRVVSNLLLNAIRHTPSDGTVEVTGRAVGDSVELAVTDGCGGLSHEDMARVFDVAWQGSSARTPTPDSPTDRGAGLGLAIVKGIVEAHRGRVAVANQAPGCRFVVTLPA